MTMREIKFRAWHVGTKRMIQPCYAELFKDGSYCAGDGNWSSSVPDVILMQYTGLKDKNGKEIYEGDIRHGKYFVMTETAETLEVVKWDDHGACFVWERIKGGEMPDFIGTEIIGNVYENPELLTA